MRRRGDLNKQLGKADAAARLKHRCAFKENILIIFFRLGGREYYLLLASFYRAPDVAMTDIF